MIPLKMFTAIKLFLYFYFSIYLFLGGFSSFRKFKRDYSRKKSLLTKVSLKIGPFEEKFYLFMAAVEMQNIFSFFRFADAIFKMAKL